MFEEYYKPLPDVDAYLKRIGVERRSELTKAYLDKLVFAHQCAVPFESTYISEYKKPILLDTDSLYRKIVLERRGGYCFELNGAFHLLLKGLGFDAWSCPCRVTLGASDDDILRPVLHRGNVVRLENKLYFCDVGFGGPMPKGAVAFADTDVQELGGERFKMEMISHGKYRLKRITRDGTLENILWISVADWPPVDFIAPNLICSDPAGHFSARMASMQTVDGYISLVGNDYTVSRNGKTVKRQVTEEEGREILKTVFGL